MQERLAWRAKNRKQCRYDDRSRWMPRVTFVKMRDFKASGWKGSRKLAIEDVCLGASRCQDAAKSLVAFASRSFPDSWAKSHPRSNGHRSLWIRCRSRRGTCCWLAQSADARTRDLVISGMETGLVRGTLGNGSELFQLACALPASGNQCALLSRWPMRGQCSAMLLQSYFESRAYEPASLAWQRSLLSNWEERFDLASEPISSAKMFMLPVVPCLCCGPDSFKWETLFHPSTQPKRSQILQPSLQRQDRKSKLARSREARWHRSRIL